MTKPLGPSPGPLPATRPSHPSARSQGQADQDMAGEASVTEALPGPEAEIEVEVEVEAQAEAKAEGAGAAPVDLGATVTLSPEALAALIEEVKSARKKES